MPPFDPLTPPTPDASVCRIVDAALNRAGEGLRVVEDYLRFVLDDAFLVAQVKSLRHELGMLARSMPSDQRHAARDTQRDVGTAISTASEACRSDAWEVCAASLKRAEQSLRSLEEFGKLVDAGVAEKTASLRYRLYTLEKAIDVGRGSVERLAGVTLCVLLDGCGSPSDFQRMAQTLLDAGVGMIQLRDKSLDDRRLTERARLLVSLARRHPPAPPSELGGDSRPANESLAEPGAGQRRQRRTLIVINDRADIAAAVQAEGVHLGQDDLPVKDARSVVGTRMLIGVSTHNIEQARAAVLDGANYLGAGPTFPSSTKSFDAFAGTEYLAQLAREIRLPAFAIGGITAANLGDVLATGFSRVAVGGAITGADKPGCVAVRMLDMLHGNPRG